MINKCIRVGYVVFMSSVNQSNLLADRKVWGQWSGHNKEYFANPDAAESLWQLFEQNKADLPQEIEVVEFGSADGYLGEFFVEKLLKRSQSAPHID